TRIEESASSADTMAVDTAGVDRALGAIGTTFRLTRLYPPSHPAVMEALRQIGEVLPVLAALGTVEWKIGATGLHWHGQQLLPRNSQIAELAGLLYARGVRVITLNPGMTADHVLALFGVAVGTMQPDLEALRQIGEVLPVLAALGTVEWKIGATGLHWHGQQLLPRNSQIAARAGVVYARGVRVITLNPGMTADHVLALFGVAVGTMQPDDAALGRIALALGRRSSLRLERLRAPAPAAGLPVVPVPAPAATPSPATPAAPAVAAPPAAAPRVHDVAGRRAGVVFRPDVLPIDVEAKRAVASLGSAATPELQLAAVEHLRALAPQLLGLHDTGPVAEAIAALDHLLTTTQEPALLAAIDQTALA